MPAQIYLASQSPRRRDLLSLWGVSATLLLPESGEDVEALEAEREGETPLQYVSRVTQAKLSAAQARLLHRQLVPRPILCADTTVTLNDEILGKPRSVEDAKQLLTKLSGQTHEVLTSVAVGHWDAHDQWLSFQRVSRSLVRFSSLSARQIDRYVATEEPFGKAGGYGIQGVAALFIDCIHGSYSGIMGLPAYETGQLLEAVGVELVVSP
jgi:septum formation protein